MHILLAKPRGFCAGVDRAIKIVEHALERYGAPVYVLKHIVHNAHVVEKLRRQGAVFVKTLEEVPEESRLLFSAHGVSPDRHAEAKARHLHVIDATCPLVAKVHKEIRRFAEDGYTIIYIGDAGHDETLGAVGWAPEHIRLVRTEEDAWKVSVADPERVAYITQTTLSIVDCEDVANVLRARFPKITAPKKPDICYATSNRQMAVLSLVPEVDKVLVVGDPESANSCRLRDIALKLGKPSYLIQDASRIDKAWLCGDDTILLTSGASAPDHLIREVIEFLKQHFGSTMEERSLVEEDVHFQLPPI
ncbi:MAG TPA: 4-hydroxy-3-methylbut-2-enyl diphosphate reductase [Candidatus Hydrogenedentes bacterium]|jgi:4-hydroxy-3-methylbut-2-enyl diphosphate reductase|nr:MAG: 4-hydroxy-3-methylbut-2-enyl diphosphate reductase [Candidatus Hydrogenedentes bacterium ADurb.Bin170]HNZ48911.1 4-hydroxy-3-methylbut-2-enyl diphosphate reductase [Candidatus Hydrogenedentota bacterium]HOD95610.1 4-hydroxy-3-methylbut-2-enyl diphosphate reductase [Candidatus Hydrogenedentota bacterium]HOH43103.1 4-hydroxy-3-methylbut-2-enyl diphosphate reductase [Candidatus Hydrogenedentota bacterium]HOM47702.1 4-hydroxy-3-methylbut-2-enyl diphosphate reductase [Candidatus Hydrogeneden